MLIVTGKADLAALAHRQQSQIVVPLETPEVAAMKVPVAGVAFGVMHRAIQVHGGAGISNDFPLASMYAHLRTIRLADGSADGSQVDDRTTRACQGMTVVA